jgi:hypothetical protein
MRSRSRSRLISIACFAQIIITSWRAKCGRQATGIVAVVGKHQIFAPPPLTPVTARTGGYSFSGCSASIFRSSFCTVRCR